MLHAAFRTSSSRLLAHAPRALGVQAYRNMARALLGAAARDKALGVAVRVARMELARIELGQHHLKRAFDGGQQSVRFRANIYRTA